jgi:hypothetical protein
MAKVSAEQFLLPPGYYHWLEVVRRFPMFNVWRGGVLCSVKLHYVLEPSGGERDIFAHLKHIEGVFPEGYLPLGYDVFGNLLLWDLRGGSVYLHWRGTSPLERVVVAPSLEEFCDKLYYRPIH